MRKIIKRKSLVDSVVELFLHKIKIGELKAGRLPSQEALAEQFNVSRVVFREALNKLLAMGMVEVIHGKGTYLVEEGKREFISQSVTSKMFFQNKKNLLHLLETRLIIETQTVVLACQRASEKNIADLETLINKMAENVKDYAQYELLDLDFHILIAEASGNPMLKEITIFVEDGYRMAPTEFYKMPRIIQKVQDEHQKIFEAIKARDEQKAKEIMKIHLSFPQQILDNL